MLRLTVAGLALLGLVSQGPSAAAQGADPQVVLVPFAPNQPLLPHPAHGEARITLKGMLRNANCAQGYEIRWDLNRNGNYADDPARVVTPVGGVVRDIGVTYTVPQVAQDQSTNVDVRVLNRCTQAEAFGTYRLFTYTWVPSPDPRLWTDDQVDIMGQMAIQEALWYIHRRQEGHANVGAAIKSSMGGGGNAAAGSPLAMWAMALNGHLAAYPPGTLDPLGQPLPEGWAVENDRRWNATPYAEDSIRMLNYVLERGTGWNPIQAVDEANTCGLDRQGNVARCNRVVAANGQGLYTNGVANNTYYQGVTLGGLAPLLPALAGSPLQTGGVARGMLYEAFVQELTDWLGAMQIDSGCGRGGWYYTRIDGNGACSIMDASTAQWGYIGLESAEQSGHNYGVFVNNQHKYSLADNLVANQGNRGGSSYRTSGAYPNNLQLTGGAFVAARWLGIHRLNRGDNTRPFPGESNHNAERLRRSYDEYLSFTANAWNVRGGGWNNSDSMWVGADYLCGNTNSVYSWGNASQCGNLYSIYSHQKGYRTVDPHDPDKAEQGLVGGQDWARQFSIYTMRSQDRNVNDYNNFGRISDCGQGPSASCNYGGNAFSTPSGALVLTPTLFNPKPIAIGRATPSRVVEGCAGGNNGLVTFRHNQSFHPGANARIVRYEWDPNDADGGLWWEGAGPQPQDVAGALLVTDDPSRAFVFRYPTAGVFTVTLRVTDDSGQTRTTSMTVVVDATENVPPVAAHGGPYVLEVGEDLQLAGTASDPNAACGDVITAGWDLDNNDRYDDLNVARGRVAWADVERLIVNRPGFRLGQPQNITLRVRDSRGDEAVATTQLTVFGRDPVAEGRASPNPARCPEEVRFDGSRSFHPNPDRRIVEYRWDVDGLPGVDGGGGNPSFDFTYERFGTFPVTLTVVDDRNRSASQAFQVEVNRGNAAPFARLAQAQVIVLAGGDLVLDASNSSDPNARCGDAIVEYAFDLNGDGDFDDPVDVVGPAPVIQIPWAQLSQFMRFPADPTTQLPNNPVTLRVTDRYGLSSQTTATVAIFRTEPRAVIVQRPNPAGIDRDTGRSDVSLDGRESFSPRPGGQIVRYEWDTNDDGIFGDAGGEPSVLFRRIFNPIPDAQNPPEVFVRLRVTDDLGETATARLAIDYRVGAVPPTADADPTDPPERGYAIRVGDPLVLNAVQSTDPNEAEGDRIALYRWALNHDPDAPPVFDIELADDNGDREEALVTVSVEQLAAAGMDQPGSYLVLLEVRDTVGLSGQDTTTVTVYPRDPVAEIRADRNPAACGQRVTLDASGSGHPSPLVDAVSWAWDLDDDGAFDDGDGVQLTFEPEAFTFGAPLTVAVRVVDSAGGTDVATLELPVTAGNSSPTADPGGPYLIAVGDAVTLDGRRSFDPDAACGDGIVRYGWDVGDDGQIDREGAALSQVALSWAELEALGVGARGRHVVRLQAQDRFGEITDARVPLEIYNGPTAVAELTPARVGCNVLVEFEGGGSFADGPVDQGFGIVRWDWAFTINGVPVGEASGRTVARNAQGGDQVQGRLTVTDASGRQATTTVDLEIVNNNLPPEADAGGPYFTGPVGAGFAGVDLDARASRDPNAPCDSIARWEWDTDGDGLFGAEDLNGAGGLAGSDYVGDVIRGYQSPAWRVGLTQTVRVRACDQSGACGQPAEATIEVLDQAPPAGEILSPRADQDACVGGGVLVVRYAVRDPDGDRVRVELLVDGEPVQVAQVDTPAGGAPVERSFNLDAASVSEGRHELSLRLTDPAGVSTLAGAGGLLPFDRTPPAITIGPELVEDACYNPADVPAPAIVVADILDPAPEVVEDELRVGCQRIRTIQATDHCGNAVQAQREYRVAEPVQIELTGPAPNALVASARIGWRVVGPETCANQITARLSQDGIPDRVYVANTEVVEPGNYTLALTVPDCAGNTRQVLRAFRINAPPVAVPITAGHANRDPQGVGAAYLVTEGAALTLDGGDSRAPELDDAVATWAWDFDGDGQVDANGRQVPFPTQEDGFFEGRLTVTDGFGASHSAPFAVLVQDVNPVANPGGPYIVRQGEALVFDGSASRPGSAADPISSYHWDFGDGSPPEEGPALVAPQHTYDRDGLYDVRLVVRDEDSAHQATVQVVVRDVNPVIDQIVLPADAYDGARLDFAVQARPGAPLDPIIAYEWDFDGDGRFDSVLPDGQASWRYEEPGDYEAVLRVRDSDSTELRRIPITVRPGTFVDELNALSARARELLEVPAVDPRIRAALEPEGQPAFEVWATRGRWAEARGYRGNTLVALDELTFRVVRAQALGADFGDRLWRVSRRLLRSLQAQQAFAAGRVPNDRPSLIRGDRSLATAQALFADPDFEDSAEDAVLSFVVRDLFAVMADAYFYFADAVDPNQTYNGFPMPDIRDPVAKVAAAEGVNQNLVFALRDLARDWDEYLLAGGAGDPGPGRAEVQRGLDLLNAVRPLVAKDIGLNCEGENCLTDRESLELQLMLMDLVGELFAAADQGVYVRQFQNLLTLGIKFRVEVAILRIEFVCGANTPLPRAAREQQRILLDLVDRGESATALLFYIAPERRCLVVREYNECIVVFLPEDNEAVDYPPLCVSDLPGDGEDGGDGGEDPQNPGFPGGDPPIPLRPAFSNLALLLDILTAFLTEPPIDVMEPAVRAARFPLREEEDFDRNGDGDFDLNDVDRALMQFIHDPVDIDQDGLIGIIELDCFLPGVAGHLDPERVRTFDGVHDGSLDCDGDGLTNAEEVALGLNPLVARDAMQDLDGDGIPNLVEVRNGLNPRDPADGRGDLDGDGLTNAQELIHGLDPRNPNDFHADFDGDGLSNGVEILNGLDPWDPTDADADPDGDGMSSRQEIALGRNPLVADCAADPVELAGRNDSPETATVLGAVRTLTVRDHTVCNNGEVADVDFFRFTVDVANARLIVRLLHNRAAGDLDLRLFNAEGGGQVADSSTAFDTEIIDVPRGQLARGDYLLRVQSRNGGQGDYTLEVQVVPPEVPCVPDAFEGPAGNDRLGDATALEGEARLGAWICGAERRTGDWFQVPLDGADRTVHIRYARDTDGQLRLAAMNGDLSAFTESLEVQTNAQCINLRATGQPSVVYLNVTASTVFSDGDDRVDYVLQVVDTDLDADPRGACDLLSGGLFRFVTWPTLRP